MTTTPETPSRAASSARPTLADGIELIGEYEDSGFQEPPYIVRRGDGQVVQLPRLLYLVAESADGRRDLAAIAERVADAYGRPVSADNVRFLVEKKLRPLGVLAKSDGSSPKLKRADPMLALKFRAALVPEGVVRAITTVFYPLFFPPVIVAVVAALVALDVWLFAYHGIAQSARTLIYQPVFMLLVLALVVLSAAFHECGHATACRYGGAKPGVMGAGIYIVWPAFYTDVTDAYRLGKWGRLRTDLGGIYFNGIFSLATYGAYFVTGFEPLLVVVLIQHLEVLHQLLPFLRLDGYYIISDLTGVPDMFARVKPTLRSMLPGKEEEGSVQELKPWVRAATRMYVLALIPVLVFVLGMLIFNVPRLFATAWDSFFVQWDRLSQAWGDGNVVGAAAGTAQIFSLALPVAGISLTGARGSKRALAGAWAWSAGAPLRRATVIATTALVAGSMGLVWWPNGDYRPIQPGEKGTLQGAAAQFGDVDTGRPGLTNERANDLGGAPSVGRDGASLPGEEPEDPTAPADEGEDPAGEESDGATVTEPADTTETTETTETEPSETTETETETTTP